MVGPRELESLTSSVSTRRSNQLSYGPGIAIVPDGRRTDQTEQKPPVSGRLVARDVDYELTTTVSQPSPRASRIAAFFASA